MVSHSFRRNIPSYAYLALLLFFGLSSWFINVNDNDFWWHIKTGQYILEHRSLPDKDPFTFTFIEHDRDVPERPEAILKSYWLSQIILYLIYQHTGPIGIILLKIFVFGLILILLWKYLLEEGASPLLGAIMLAGYVIFAKEYMTERPQIFSFLFAAIVFYLLESIRKAYSVQREAGSKNSSDPYPLHATRYTLPAKRYPLFSKAYTLPAASYTLPLVMLIWANMHGGYFVGIAFIMIYAVCLAVTRGGLRSKTPFLIFYLVSAFITLANPVTYHLFTTFVAFQDSMLQRGTLEFLSPLKMIGYLGINWYPYFVLIILSLAVVALSILGRLLKKAGAKGNQGKKGKEVKQVEALPLEHTILLAGTAIASLSSLRYGMFFMIVAVPVIAAYFNRGFFLNIPKAISNGALAVFCVFLFILSFSGLLFQQSRDTLIEPSFVPLNAAEFIKRKAPEANILNDINWGGYLIWKLYPGYKMFIDTRTLNPEVYKQYMRILDADETPQSGMPGWKVLLSWYNVNTIVHSTVHPYSGKIYPLMLKLLRDEEWHLVYIDGVAAVFVKKMSPNFFEFPKDQLLKEMRWEAMRGLERFPNHPGFIRTLNMLGTLR